MKRFNRTKQSSDQILSKLKEQYKREQVPVEKEYISQRIEHYTRTNNRSTQTEPKPD